jgi:hypothetical protein
MDTGDKVLIGLGIAAAVGAGYYFLVYKPNKDAQDKLAGSQNKALPPAGMQADAFSPNAGDKKASPPPDNKGAPPPPPPDDTPLDPECHSGNILVDVQCTIDKQNARAKAASDAALAAKIRAMTAQRLGVYAASRSGSPAPTGPTTGRAL